MGRAKTGEGRKEEQDRERESERLREGREREEGERTRVCGVRAYARHTSCAYVRYRGIRQFAIYCLDFNLPSEWPWALPPLPTDIRRRKLPIVSMELDSYCAATFMPQRRARSPARSRACERACMRACVRACVRARICVL